ncbi:MAG: hypothetical protein A3E64_01060 [Candidatus Harrisonbacteria bacterium RIFCSPHIGHO2_12_FULL_48_16]|uniref:Uncharacterized protein n=1 Tax=Candidatus Harrisonbacteria bacterium RIFCSPHIGHO2_12_FULL_48_16 TaxID=1798405 RepID=A0A1G1ZGG7_9BACT|nr:MAG: hypothetical protein A3E64_01060 [Candidatus Harrisonbacteria bacterium RIFCSPHIGHO2_12_FULL_48_16]
MKGEKVNNDNASTSFVVISGLDFPKRSRKYLMDLTKQVAEKFKAAFVIVAGHAMNGAYLESQLKKRLKATRDAETKVQIRKDFIAEMASSFNEFLPTIKDVNYHIVVAERIYDREIGYEILKEVQKLRGGAQGDIRLFTDSEVKIPVQLPGFGDVRVLVPRNSSWFYENVTGVMQRLINGFALRANSDPPPLIVVGCTGTGAFIPRYRGIPCIATGTHHKLQQQDSTENMVSCTVVTIDKKDSGVFQVTWNPIDYRTVIYNEKELALPKDLARCHHKVLQTLMPSSASMSTIEFRINSMAKNPWGQEKVEKTVKELKDRGVIVYNKTENRYAIASDLINKINVSLSDLFKNSKTLTFVQKSCWHVGALKTLYWTVLRDEPKLAEDVDAIVVDGDVNQGISHNYEYNGELLPTMNGVDKQQILAAKMQAKIIMDVFAARWAKLSEKRCTKKAIDRCLVRFIFKEGNHDEPRFSGSKDSIALKLFENELASQLVSQLNLFLEAHKCSELKNSEVEALVKAKMIRVGETSVTKVNGVPIGLMHPHQGKTQAKGQRIQQTCNYFRERFIDSHDEDLRKIAVVGVANFHEAAAICTAAFGRTMLGIMTASEVYDTKFEQNFNKVVEFGMAKVKVEFNESGQFLSASVQYSMKSVNEIAKEDQRIVFCDALTNEVVSRQCWELSKLFDAQWR